MPLDSRNNYPFWMFQHVPLVVPIAGTSLGPVLMIKKLLDGWNYHLQGLLVGYDADAATPDEAPIMHIQLVQTERSIPLFETSLDVRNISSPGPARASGARSRAVHAYLPIDHLFSFSDVIQLRISGHAGGFPTFIDVVIVGRNVRRGKLT